MYSVCVHDAMQCKKKENQIKPRRVSGLWSLFFFSPSIRKKFLLLISLATGAKIFLLLGIRLCPRSPAPSVLQAPVEIPLNFFMIVGGGCVAQLVEHRAFNLMVVGSNPTTPIVPGWINGFNAKKNTSIQRCKQRVALFHTWQVRFAKSGEMAEWLKALVC